MDQLRPSTTTPRAPRNAARANETRSAQLPRPRHVHRLTPHRPTPSGSQKSMNSPTCVPTPCAQPKWSNDASRCLPTHSTNSTTYQPRPRQLDKPAITDRHQPATSAASHVSRRPGAGLDAGQVTQVAVGPARRHSPAFVTGPTNDLTRELCGSPRRVSNTCENRCRSGGSTRFEHLFDRSSMPQRPDSRQPVAATSWLPEVVRCVIALTGQH